ncbi:hypothetical protein RFI_21442, partial [Reticulomyxa filosa]
MSLRIEKISKDGKSSLHSFNKVNEEQKWLEQKKKRIMIDIPGLKNMSSIVCTCFFLPPTLEGVKKRKQVINKQTNKKMNKDLRLKCPRCPQVFSSQKEVCRHLRLHPNPKACPYCEHIVSCMYNRHCICEHNIYIHKLK